MNYWHNNNAFLNQRCVRIRPYCDSPISSIQVLHAIKPYIKAKEQHAKGSTVGHLSDKDIKGLYLFEPKVSQLFNPRKAFDPILKQIIKNKQEIAALTRQRDELLPLLMNGQVEVKQLNSDFHDKPFAGMGLCQQWARVLSSREGVGRSHRCPLTHKPTLA